MTQGFSLLAAAAAARAEAEDREAAAAAAAAYGSVTETIKRLTEIADGAEMLIGLSRVTDDRDLAVEAAQLAKTANALRNIFENSEAEPARYAAVVDSLEALVGDLLGGY